MRDLFQRALRPTPVGVTPGDVAEAARGREITEEDIEDFRALGAEVCLRSETYGDVWLVPAYTHTSGRKEMTMATAVRILGIVRAFHGSKIKAIRMKEKV